MRTNTQQSDNPTYDAVVIGSGMGSLTTAAILSKFAGKKVLILEQHWTIGGLTHSFERQRKYSWDVGIHYVGQVVGKNLPAQVFDYISDGKMEWERIADPYDTFVYPDMRFEVPSGKQAYIRRLIELFPQEQKAIRGYFKDINRVGRWSMYQYIKRIAPHWVSRLLALWGARYAALASMTTQDYLDTHFKDERLKALLVSQWGDYGVTPQKSNFFIQAVIAGHYMDGAYYPKGGSKQIAKTILPVIEAAGGSYLLHCQVQEILVESGKAVGCRCRVKRGDQYREEFFYAPIIISGAGAHPTYRRMLRQPLFPELETQLHQMDSMITVYLGLKDNPARLGVGGGNFWIFDSYNHQSPPPQHADQPLDFKFCFLSFPSLKDQQKKSHTAELITMLPYDFFRPWAHLPWQNRGEDYTQLKQQIAEQLLKIVERTLPGFGDLVDYIEVATPLSMEQFTGRAQGAQYGMAQTPERLQMACYQPQSPIQNLYLTGGDVFALGLVGALMGGVSAACSILGKWGFAKVIPAITGAKKTKPSPPLESWQQPNPVLLK